MHNPNRAFPSRRQIDSRYFEKPYYIMPREEISQESFAVIRDAMSQEGRCRLCARGAVLTRAAVSARADGPRSSRRNAALRTRGPK
ncbi:Ku protein [Bradyrhizobium algeriense]|uniref:Ku protein n=1 Tax=Bradyrhizobium algeriense TaxID=634784 RepID=UPI003A839405